MEKNIQDNFFNEIMNGNQIRDSGIVEKKQNEGILSEEMDMPLDHKNVGSTLQVEPLNEESQLLVQNLPKETTQSLQQGKPPQQQQQEQEQEQEQEQGKVVTFLPLQGDQKVVHVEESLLNLKLDESFQEPDTKEDQILRELENLVLKLDKAVTKDSNIVSEALVEELQTALDEHVKTKTSLPLPKVPSTTKFHSTVPPPVPLKSDPSRKVAKKQLNDVRNSIEKHVKRRNSTGLHSKKVVDQQIPLDQQIRQREERRLKEVIKDDLEESHRTKEYEMKCEQEKKRMEREERQLRLEEKRDIDLRKSKEKKLELEEVHRVHVLALQQRQKELKDEKEKKRIEMQEAARKRRQAKDEKIAKIQKEAALQRAEIQERLDESRKENELRLIEIRKQQEEARKQAAIKKQDKLDLQKAEKAEQLKEKEYMEEERKRDLQWREMQAKQGKSLAMGSFS